MRMKVIVLPVIVCAQASAAFGAPSISSVPLATVPAVSGSASHTSHYRHYGHYRHSGHSYGHYRHYGHYHHDASVGDAMAAGSGDTGESFVRDGRRYYWHFHNGHRFYSSRPEAGDGSEPEMTVGEDLDAPLSREERAERAARIHKAQARLAAVEQRVAHQRHLHRLHEIATKPRQKHK